MIGALLAAADADPHEVVRLLGNIVAATFGVVVS